MEIYDIMVNIPLLASLSNALVGYAAIFICMGLALFFLQTSAGKLPGPGYWSLSLLLNAAGFLLWSGFAPGCVRNGFVVGDAFHMLGFLALVYGVYRFTGIERQWPFAVGSVIVILAWIGTMSLIARHSSVGFVPYSLLRSLIFVAASVLVFRRVPADFKVGRHFAAWALLVWGVYVLASPLLARSPSAFAAVLGLLVGLQLLATLGLIILIVDRLRVRAEEFEHHLQHLEVLLPICSYCKRIRDDEGEWHILEEYLNEHTTAKFSHGICPDCAREHYPKLGLYPKN